MNNNKIYLHVVKNNIKVENSLFYVTLIINEEKDYLYKEIIKFICHYFEVI